MYTVSQRNLLPIMASCKRGIILESTLGVLDDFMLKLEQMLDNDSTTCDVSSTHTFNTCGKFGTLMCCNILVSISNEQL